MLGEFDILCPPVTLLVTAVAVVFPTTLPPEAFVFPVACIDVPAADGSPVAGHSRSRLTPIFRWSHTPLIN